MNIIVDLNYPIKDGTEVVFRSPVDCSRVKGLLVNYQDNGNCSKEFAFADAHGNNVGDIDHLFAENVAVKVILDVTTGMAFVQNADTNAYLEGRFAELEDKIGTGGGADLLTVTIDVSTGDASHTPEEIYEAVSKGFITVLYEYTPSIFDGYHIDAEWAYHLGCCTPKYAIFSRTTEDLCIEQYRINEDCSTEWLKSEVATVDAVLAKLPIYNGEVV